MHKRFRKTEGEKYFENFYPKMIDVFLLCMTF